MYEAFNPRAINGTPFADVPPGYRILYVAPVGQLMQGDGYRWQRIADGYTSIPYPTHERAAKGAAADAVYKRTSKRGAPTLASPRTFWNNPGPF